jgi:hypothetical protein
VLNSKRSPVARALLVRDASGTIRVIRTDSSNVDWWCSEYASDAVDIGMARDRDCPNASMYLWTGTLRMEHESHESYGQPTEPVWDGTFREIGVAELADLLLMESPTCKVCGGDGQDGDEAGVGPCGACDWTGERKAVARG